MKMILKVCVDVYVMVGGYFICEISSIVKPFLIFILTHTHTHTHMHTHMYVYIFVDLVKHGVFTLVGVILHYRYGHYYYCYYYLSCASRQ